MEHAITRAFLSIAIVVSLVPHDWLGVDDVWFLLVFGPEFLAFVILACRHEGSTENEGEAGNAGWRRPRAKNLALVAVDFVALLSFLPLSVGAFAGARWLRLFRLTRMLMLFRFWGPVLRDISTVVRSRERGRQVTLMAGAVLVVCFAGVIVLNHTAETVGDDFDADGEIGDAHDHDFLVRTWWAFRQVEDPGNMLASPHEIATTVVSLGLTVFGLFVFSFLMGLGADSVRELMSLSKIRPVGLTGHTVLINADVGTRELLFGLIHASARRGVAPRRGFVVVGRAPEQPEFLKEPELGRVEYRYRPEVDDETSLDCAEIAAARRLVVLAQRSEPDPDSSTIRTVITIAQRLADADNSKSLCTALLIEIIDKGNLGAMLTAAQSVPQQTKVEIIPTETLVATSIAFALRCPGGAALLDRLLESSGARQLADAVELAGNGHGSPPYSPPILPSPPPRRVLICGFRPSSEVLVESLLSACSDPRVLVLVESERTKATVLERLVSTIPASSPDRGQLWVEVGEWTSARRLLDLPHLGSVLNIDAMIVLAGDRAGHDGRTAAGLMKLDSLRDHHARQGRAPSALQIVAEVHRAELAGRLNDRYRANQIDTRVFSRQRLRSSLMLQSALHSGFGAMLSGVLGNSKGLARLAVAPREDGAQATAELVRTVRARGDVPLAVELEDGNVRVLSNSEVTDGLERARSIWVVRGSGDDPTP